MLTTLASFSVHADPPDEQAREAIHNTDKTFAVAFNANGCQMCRALAPALRDLVQEPEFIGITLFVAKFDTEKVLERSLGISDQEPLRMVGLPIPREAYLACPNGGEPALKTLVNLLRNRERPHRS